MIFSIYKGKIFILLILICLTIANESKDITINDNIIVENTFESSYISDRIKRRVVDRLARLRLARRRRKRPFLRRRNRRIQQARLQSAIASINGVQSEFQTLVGR
uniref:Uncharacterized protein n=1 Tax=Parastrongyloides trichosuri TaxID=131310 RepID=A0A0N4ZZY7_PARTI